MDEFSLDQHSPPLPTAMKGVMTVHILGWRALTVLAVSISAWLTPLSVLASLIVLFVLLSAMDLAGIWLGPPDRKGRSGHGGPGTAGDRFPRRPFPSGPGASAEIEGNSW